MVTREAPLANNTRMRIVSAFGHYGKQMKRRGVYYCLFYLMQIICLGTI